MLRMAMVSAELGQPAPGDVEDRGNGMISATFPLTGLPEGPSDQEQWLALLEQRMNHRIAFDAQLLVGSNFPARIHIGGTTTTSSGRSRPPSYAVIRVAQPDTPVAPRELAI